MSNFEFISYTPTPTDQYMLGFAKVKVFGKIELRFKHVKTKDGAGTFFTCANYTVQDPVTQEKKYIPCFLLDSRGDEETLMEIIRDGVNRVISQRSAMQSQPPQGQIHYPHGLVQQKPSSMSEVAVEEQLPF